MGWFDSLQAGVRRASREELAWRVVVQVNAAYDRNRASTDAAGVTAVTLVIGTRKVDLRLDDLGEASITTKGEAPLAPLTLEQKPSDDAPTHEPAGYRVSAREGSPTPRDATFLDLPFDLQRRTREAFAGLDLAAIRAHGDTLVVTFRSKVAATADAVATLGAAARLAADLEVALSEIATARGAAPFLFGAALLEKDDLDDGSEAAIIAAFEGLAPRAGPSARVVTRTNDTIALEWTVDGVPLALVADASSLAVEASADGVTSEFVIERDGATGWKRYRPEPPGEDDVYLAPNVRALEEIGVLRTLPADVYAAFLAEISAGALGGVALESEVLHADLADFDALRVEDAPMLFTTARLFARVVNALQAAPAPADDEEEIAPCTACGARSWTPRHPPACARCAAPR